MTKQELKDLAQVVGGAVIVIGLVWFWQSAKKEEEAREQAAEQQAKEAQSLTQTSALNAITKKADNQKARLVQRAPSEKTKPFQNTRERE